MSEVTQEIVVRSKHDPALFFKREHNDLVTVRDEECQTSVLIQIELKALEKVVRLLKKEQSK